MLDTENGKLLAVLDSKMDRMLSDMQEFKVERGQTETRLRAVETKVAVMSAGYGALGGGVAALILALISKAFGL